MCLQVCESSCKLQTHVGSSSLPLPACLQDVQDDVLDPGVDAFQAIPLPALPEHERPDHDGNEQHEGGIELPASPMQKAAEHLQYNLGRHSGILTTHAAQALGLDRKALRMNLGALAELAVCVPMTMLRGLTTYIQQTKAETLQPIAVIHRQAYDSTPSSLRVPDANGGREQRRVKLCMIEK